MARAELGYLATTGQASRAAHCLRDHQRLYNAALEERRRVAGRRRIIANPRFARESGYDPR